MITKADMRRYDTKLVHRTAEETKDAYSFGLHYSLREWRRITRYLIEEGYSIGATKDILYSKYMRWGADYSNAYRMTLEKFVPYFEKERKGIDEMLLTEFGIPKPQKTR